ncbi:MAG: hypothetical protein JWQ97_3328, partial [Phenylobacterium sp.]|nr:hypothetical protein [Phenylobacterium sp.]
GNHVTIMRAPRVANLARDLRARIVQAAGQKAQARRLDTPDPIRAAAAPDASCLSG